MSSPYRTSVIVALVLLTACRREQRKTEDKSFATTVPAGTQPGLLVAGGQLAFKPDPKQAAYEHNANALAEGQRLFSWMNCVGCHSHGGGGMGPALMDDEWRYGGRIDQIAATIVEGRPNGMPSFRGKLTDDQVWKVAAYVRSLSGQPTKDVVSSRADELSGTPPQTLEKREPVHPAESTLQ
ncbi:MAG: cytochrome c [Sphingomicrobium sp.]|nr:c-type cytochrome [Sphingomonadales bacterium]